MNYDREWMIYFFAGVAITFAYFELPDYWQKTTYKEQVNEFVDRMYNNKIGDSADIWLVKTSNVSGGISANENKVGLFFGYLDDMAQCTEIQTYLNAKYPTATYYCVNANFED